ncbi:uncharacterized protein LOC108915999 [Anoplophora glabripennis]|uniref:uncharacterized protein LOC108915999 n=1 Tax=Anoplophora glabripennis TaxID=217634 RepID=UPI0008759EE3|nr:uncharacterized protein LOC108915999 [Anoplophora glabripennis]
MNFLNANSFFDMCISEACFSQGNVEETLKMLYNYGYRTIAINYLVDDGNIEHKKKKKKGDSRSTFDLVPVPYITEKVKDWVSKLKLENFEVLNRLTIAFSNQELLHKIGFRKR